MKKNPFKFGSIVDDEFFTNREDEIVKVRGVLNSENHLIVIAPRRYGKSSLVFKAIGEIERPVISLDLQLVTSPQDLASQLLKRIYRVFPRERVRQYIKNFRIIPNISLNPVSNEISVNFSQESKDVELFEDVLNLLETLSSKSKKLIVVFDEFQSLEDIGDGLFGKFRAIMQHHKLVNYVFLGSQESMIRNIFEKKRSPFYHFGIILPLKRIPKEKFLSYLFERFEEMTDHFQEVSEQILAFSGCHPYYTQKLAFFVWEMLIDAKYDSSMVLARAIDELLGNHDVDYERIWSGFNRTDKKVLIAIASSVEFSLSETILRKYSLGPTSTAYSSLKRLLKSGYVIKGSDFEEIDDPFFREWIIRRREA